MGKNKPNENRTKKNREREESTSNDFGPGFLLCKNYAVQDLDESLRKHTTGGLRDMKECDTHR